MKNKIKVHIIGERTGYKLNDVAYIRLYSAFQLLKKEKRLDISYSDIDLENYDFDIIIVQRTISNITTIFDAEKLIKSIHLKNKKLIYEIDDNLLDMPEVSSKSKYIIRMFIKKADTIIVSTHELKKRIEKLNNNVVVIPNYIDNSLLNNKINNNEKITIGYMGTFTHQKEFQMIKLPLMRILNKYKNSVRLEIIGAIEDTSSIKSLPNAEIKERVGVTDYFSFWKWMNDNISWDIGLAPLKYNEFTNCKSDIKYLDYSAMGISGIYSNHPAYINTVKHKETGILTDNNCDDWFNSLENLIINKDLRQKISFSARNDLIQNRLLENNVNKWLNILK